MTAGESFNQLPNWAKGVIAVAAVAAIGFLGYNAYNAIKRRNEEKDIRKDEQSLKNDGQKPSFPDSNYKNFAEKIYQAGFVFGGTDENGIYDVFKQMKNDLDVVLLTKAFGTRRVEFSFQDANLGGFLSSELDSKEIGKLNSILESNGIKYRF